VFLAVSGDIFCDFDYRTLLPRARAMAMAPRPHMHLVMVPNPPFHPRGDFVLDAAGLLRMPSADAHALTFGNIGLYDTRLFREIERGAKVAMSPYYRSIAAGLATGERFDGRWENVGTPAQLAALIARCGHSGAFPRYQSPDATAFAPHRARAARFARRRV
jgi:MurNAc alpha-1-phosphate uridylyltransferase